MYGPHERVFSVERIVDTIFSTMRVIEASCNNNNKKKKNGSRKLVHLFSNIFALLESLFGQCDSWQMNGKEEKKHHYPSKYKDNDDDNEM